MAFQKIYLNNEETTYRIYDNGQVMNEKTGSYYKGTIRSGYRWFDLNWKNKRYTVSQHKLLAQYFIPNPNNLPIVHHIDNNRLNNSISNLEWISYSDNNLSKNKKVANPIAVSIDIDDNEQWLPFRDSIYMVSNQGRVKNSVTNKVVKGKITDNGYREYCLKYNHKKTSFFAHRLVYEVWNSPNMDIINHIDGNKLNNRIENLESVSSQENNLKAIYETKTHKFKQVAQYDMEGNLIRIYENNVAAAKAVGVKSSSIWAAIHKGYKTCGFVWKAIE